MSYAPDPTLLRTHWLHDIARLALLALLLIPVYLLLNQLWQSVFRLVVLYGLLTLFCWRLGEYMYRVMRRLPAEIPPWHGGTAAGVRSVPAWTDQRFGAAEAIRSARYDPQYVQMVLKPRLRQLLVHRMGGNSDLPLEAMDTARLAQVDTTLLAFLRRQEPVGLWARFRYRRRRQDDILDALRRLEAL
jgi:hypothetical protein